MSWADAHTSRGRRIAMKLLALTMIIFATVSPASLAESPADSVAVQIQRLRGGGSLDRSQAANALGELGAVAKAAAPALVEALGDRDSYVARAALDALCRIG